MSTALVEQARPPELVERALALRLEGHSWREVARRIGGTSDASHLWKMCAPYERLLKSDAAYETLKASVMAVAQEATAQTYEALVGREISAQQVPIVMGIANDKVAKHMSERAPVDVGGMVASVLDRLQAGGGGSVKLEISTGPASPQAVTLDVTPEK